MTTVNGNADEEQRNCESDTRFYLEERHGACRGCGAQKIMNDSKTKTEKPPARRDEREERAQLGWSGGREEEKGRGVEI